jgi:hypothetical protein
VQGEDVGLAVDGGLVDAGSFEGEGGGGDLEEVELLYSQDRPLVEEFRKASR